MVFLIFINVFYSIIKQFASRSLLISANAKIALHALRQSRNKAHRAKRNRACACKEYRRFLARAFFGAKIKNLWCIARARQRRATEKQSSLAYL